MKRGILLTVLMSLLMVVLVSCVGIPKELKLSDKSVKYENGVLTYKGKPYTGKLVASLADKKSGYEGLGFVTLKEGHLEGQTKFTFKKNKEEWEYNVKDGNLDGQYVSKSPETGEITMTLEAGVLKVLKINDMKGFKEDLTFDAAGLANGTVGKGDQTISYKDGKAPVVGEKNSFVTLKYMKETHSLHREVILNGKITQKRDTPLGLDVKTLESEILGN